VGRPGWLTTSEKPAALASAVRSRLRGALPALASAPVAISLATLLCGLGLLLLG
jgi:hypothetical protein